jgi:hypothetical protein
MSGIVPGSAVTIDDVKAASSVNATKKLNEELHQGADGFLRQLIKEQAKTGGRAGRNPRVKSRSRSKRRRSKSRR